MNFFEKFTIYIFALVLMFLFGSAPVLYAAYKQTTVTTVTTTTSDPNLVIPVTPGRVHPDINFDINMRHTFQHNENVVGEIVVNNNNAVSLPATFHIRLYQDGKFKEELVSSIDQLLPGQTKFTLAGFGVPMINRSKSSQGNWTLVIYYQDPTYSKEANFKILSSV